jgi:hypothetical protein
MTNEMELLRRACPERVVADTPAVERARRSLSIAMANEAFVLPSEDESSAIDPNPHVATIVPSSNPRRRRMRLVAVGTSVAATFAIAGVILVPTGSQVPAAAAALRHISAVAAVQSLPSPGPGQDYFNQVRVSIFDTVNGASGQSEAQATFTGVEDLWTTASGSGTGSVSWGTPQFSSAAAQAAWDAILEARQISVPLAEHCSPTHRIRRPFRAFSTCRSFQQMKRHSVKKSIREQRASPPWIQSRPGRTLPSSG